MVSPAFSNTAAVIVAAGAGLRAGQPSPKQFAPWRGKPVVRHSVEALVNTGISPIIVAIPAGAGELAAQALAGLVESGAVRFVTGGASRRESVRAGLEALAEDAPEAVLIHDAARPIIPHAVLERLRFALAAHPGAIPVLPVVDSLTHVEEPVDKPGDSLLMSHPATREQLRRVQTPQAFHYAAILAAHRQWPEDTEAGDDAQVARAAGLAVALIEGDEVLHKLTYAHDFRPELPLVRTGTGFDVHRLEEGKELWLCGLKIPHSHGLSGHSDADVAIHAAVDALLGAIGDGDIGQHFPPSDERWRGAASHQFLAHAADLVAQAGYTLGNIDLTIICEAPKIGPHRQAMRERLVEILRPALPQVDITAISVKATTTEGLGYTGRREGIAAQAVATLIRNS